MMDKPEEFKVNSRNLDLNLDFGLTGLGLKPKSSRQMKVKSEFLASHLVPPVLQGVPVGVNVAVGATVAGQRFYYVHLLPSARVAKFQRCTDQQRQDYPESA